ncbi:MAG: HDOD domain-containing protein [Acidobacteria bacterium]|nr:HDOD domain-containing protein [Acidobacteriota bacterium]
MGVLAPLEENVCQAAAQIRLPRAEEAYLCGMFRNLGEVLVATHLRKQYNRILKERGNSSGEAKACLQVLGFTYEDLGQGMARHWHMPTSVTESMGSAGSSPAPRAGKDVMETLVAFSHELTDVIYRRNPDDRQAAVALIVDKYGSSLRLGPDGVQALIATAVTETTETFAAAKIPLDGLQLRRQAEAALQGGSLETGAPEPEEEAATQAGGREKNLLDSLAAEVVAATQPGSPVQMNSILMMVLEAYHRGAGFDRVIFFLADSDRTRLRGRLGLGEDIESMIDRLEIPLAGRGEPLTGLLIGRKDTFADLPGNPAYKNSKVIGILRPRSFGLFPVVVDGAVVGGLYFDRLQPEPPPSPRVLKVLKRLRDHVAEMIRRTRAPAGTATVTD